MKVKYKSRKPSKTNKDKFEETLIEFSIGYEMCNAIIDFIKKKISN